MTTKNRVSFDDAIAGALPPIVVNAKPKTRNLSTPVKALGPVILSAVNITKCYSIGGEQRRVLDDVSFHARSGESVFLSGPSGSGKSTLLLILGCLLSCDEGEITIADQRVDNLTNAGRTLVRRDLIGFVFQRFQLIQALSAEDNVAIPLTQKGMPLYEARQRAGNLLRRVGLEHHRQHLPSAMSPGQCQRVALARAIVGKPKLILADEPTAAQMASREWK